jgi:hypothetical protein
MKIACGRYQVAQRNIIHHSQFTVHHLQFAIFLSGLTQFDYAVFLHIAELPSIYRASVPETCLRREKNVKMGDFWRELGVPEMQ